MVTVLGWIVGIIAIIAVTLGLCIFVVWAFFGDRHA